MMYDFIYNWWFIYKRCYMMGMGEKTRNTKTETRKNSPVWLLSHPLVYKMEADYFPVLRYCRHYGLEEEVKMTPILPPFVRPGSLHSPTFCRLLCDPRFFLSHLILTLSWCLKYKSRSRWEKFASSYNTLFRVVQITIWATARIARNTTRFSPWNWGKTLSTT